MILPTTNCEVTHSNLSIIIKVLISPHPRKGCFTRAVKPLSYVETKRWDQKPVTKHMTPLGVAIFCDIFQNAQKLIIIPVLFIIPSVCFCI